MTAHDRWFLYNLASAIVAAIVDDGEAAHRRSQNYLTDAYHRIDGPAKPDADPGGDGGSE